MHVPLTTPTRHFLISSLHNPFLPNALQSLWVVHTYVHVHCTVQQHALYTYVSAGNDRNNEIQENTVKYQNNPPPLPPPTTNNDSCLNIHIFIIANTSTYIIMHRYHLLPFHFFFGGGGGGGGGYNSGTLQYWNCNRRLKYYR